MKYIGLLLCTMMCLNGNIVKSKNIENNKVSSTEIKQANRIETNDTLSILNELLDEYYLMHEQDSSDERVVELISKTEEMVSFLENDEVSLGSCRIGGVSTLEVLPALTFVDATRLVIDAIAVFSAAGLKLSAELLTVAFGNTDITRHYTPVYGGRAISSSITSELLLIK